jgi:hypothetical protein
MPRRSACAGLGRAEDRWPEGATSASKSRRTARGLFRVRRNPANQHGWHRASSRSMTGSGVRNRPLGPESVRCNMPQVCPERHPATRSARARPVVGRAGGLVLAASSRAVARWRPGRLSAPA